MLLVNYRKLSVLFDNRLSIFLILIDLLILAPSSAINFCVPFSNLYCCIISDMADVDYSVMTVQVRYLAP
jgi:hypothetical protein